MSPFPFFSRLSSSCFAFSGAVVLSLTAFAPTQAQSPTFNLGEYAEYAEYNAKIDNAASSFAADVARRSGVAPVRDVERSTPTSKRVQNASTRRNTPNTSISTASRFPAGSSPANARSTDATKSQAARIWEAFLFGTPNRPVSTPKFAFAQRGVASPTQVPRLTPSPQPTQNLQTARPARPMSSPQTAAPTFDAKLADARRRRLQELNEFLAARRPEEFSRRLALKNAESPLPAQAFATVDAENNEYAENAESFDGDAPALPFLIAEPTADRSAVALRDRAEFARESVNAPFDAARANRSKIRQASNLEPAKPTESLALADDGLAAFLLPTRPNALRLSPNVFLSTDLVRLPEAAPLRETTETAQPAQTTQNPQTSPNADSLQPAQPLPNAQTSATVATPLPAEPSTDVPTLRPTARFVEPRFLPSRR